MGGVNHYRTAQTLGQEGMRGGMEWKKKERKIIFRGRGLCEVLK